MDYIIQSDIIKSKGEDRVYKCNISLAILYNIILSLNNCFKRFILIKMKAIEHRDNK